MTLRNLLIGAYPRTWRDEFGPELAGILAHRKLTPAVVADVLASAALQHLRQDPWKICAVGLALWTLGVLITGFEGIADNVSFLWLYFAGQLIVLVAGAWSGLHERCGIWTATIDSAKVASVPVAGFLVVCGLRLFQWGVPRAIQGHTVYYWIGKDFFVTVIISLLFGLAGSTLAVLVNHLRRTAPARR